MVQCCKSIKELSLKFNPLSYQMNYRVTIFDLMEGLQKLDGLPLMDKDRAIQLATS